MQDQDAESSAAVGRADLDAANLNDAERGLLDFAKLITEQAWKTTDEDVERLRNLGWNDEQIAEAVYVIAMFALFNRVADAFGLPAPDYRQMLDGGD